MLALILLKLHKPGIFMTINFKNLNFGQLILVKIIETAATRQHILKLKCTKFDFGCRLLRRKTLVRPPRTSVVWTTDRPTDMVVHVHLW